MSSSLICYNRVLSSCNGPPVFIFIESKLTIDFPKGWSPKSAREAAISFYKDVVEAIMTIANNMRTVFI